MTLNSFVRLAGMLACAGVLHVSAASAATEKVVYAFKGGTDGYSPIAGLIDVKGILYGTTSAGLTPGFSCSSSSCGTVYSITLSGTEKVLHVFAGGRDGAGPDGGLINVNGTLYGTTVSGGRGSCVNGIPCGTVFSITQSGKEKVLYSFKGSDGFNPQAELINVKGTLYGTTTVGGTGSCKIMGVSVGCGTMFSITPTGIEKTHYSFKGSGDGFGPQGGLINVHGTLYGTTDWNGMGNCSGPFGLPGCGTVFSITRGGTEKVLYSFKGGSDAGGSYARLIDVKGTLYGTTTMGGSADCGSSGCGTVFSITPSGTEKVLYAFKSGSDGSYPNARLIDINGMLYGTTYGGGTSSSGTVFVVDPTTGAETVLYTFTGGDDGGGPLANLIDVGGKLYGTTSGGGTYGDGTVFSIKL